MEIEQIIVAVIAIALAVFVLSSFFKKDPPPVPGSLLTPEQLAARRAVAKKAQGAASAPTE